jgi:hypothetical protein
MAKKPDKILADHRHLRHDEVRSIRFRYARDYDDKNARKTERLINRLSSVLGELEGLGVDSVVSYSKHRNPGKRLRAA